MPTRLTIVGRGSGSDAQKPPSAYVQERNAEKDKRQETIDKQNEAHRKWLEEQGRLMREHAEQALELQKLNTEIRQKENEWKLKEAELATKQALQLIGELSKLDSTDISPENRLKRLAIETKYPGARFNKSGNDFLTNWDSENVAARKHDEELKQKKSQHFTELNDASILATGKDLAGNPADTLSNGQKVAPMGLTVAGAAVTQGGLQPRYQTPPPAKPVKTYTPEYLDKMRENFDKQTAAYQEARTALAGAKKPEEKLKARTAAAYASKQIDSIGKRLIEVHSEKAPEIQSVLKEHQQQSLTDEHGDLESTLNAMPGNLETKRKSPTAIRLNAVKAELNKALPSDQQYQLMPDVPVMELNPQPNTAAKITAPTESAPILAKPAATPTPAAVPVESTPPVVAAPVAPIPTPAPAPVAPSASDVAASVSAPAAPKYPIYQAHPGTLRMEDVPNAPVVADRTAFDALPEGAVYNYKGKLGWKPVKPKETVSSEAE